MRVIKYIYIKKKENDFSKLLNFGNFGLLFFRDCDTERKRL